MIKLLPLWDQKLSAFHFRFDCLYDVLHCDPRILFFTFEVGLPDRLSDDELLESKKMIGNTLSLIKLASDEPYKIWKP